MTRADGRRRHCRPSGDSGGDEGEQEQDVERGKQRQQELRNAVAEGGGMDHGLSLIGKMRQYR